jgi:hypothetical protein
MLVESSVGRDCSSRVQNLVYFYGHDRASWRGVRRRNTKKMKYRDLVVCFNAILFYVKASVIKGVLI